MFGGLVEGVVLREDLTIKSLMALDRRDELDAAVTVFCVVPSGEAQHPGAGSLDAYQWLVGVRMGVFQCAEQGFQQLSGQMYGEMCDDLIQAKKEVGILFNIIYIIRIHGQDDGVSGQGI